MYRQFVCPTCQKSLKVREENVGSKVRCPYCHATLNVIAPPKHQGEPGDVMNASDSHVLSEGPTSEVLRDSSLWSSSGTEVSMARSAMYAAVAMFIFFGVVWPFRDFVGYLSRLLFEHGWVPYLLVFFGFWSAAILYLKSKKLARQKDSMLFDLLPTDIAEDITVRTAPQFLQYIHGLPSNPSESFLINRVMRGLEHFRNLQSSAEVATRLESQSEIDARAVESSYTALKVFIWAIPILGFIGTVMGIGDAVSGLSQGAQDDTLARIAAGLSTAFDTTMLALVMSLLVMFPTSSMQKSEEDLLNLVDEYCNENLLKRLKDSGRSSTASAPTADQARTIEKAIDAAMADHHAELKTWARKLETIGETITEQVTKGWTNVDSQLRNTLNSVIERQQQIVTRFEAVQSDQGQHFKAVAEAAGNEAGALARRADERQARIEKDLSELVARYEGSLTRLAEQSEATNVQIAESMKNSAKLLESHFSTMREGLASLNTVLEKLGDKHTVLEIRDDSRGEPARGWGWFRKKNGAG